MFSRFSFLNGDPTRIDELVEYVTWTVKPATDRLTGNLGLGMWVDQSSGAALVTTVWSDATSMAMSESAVTKMRDDGAAVIRGAVTVEHYEIALVDRLAPHHVGNVMSLVRTSADPLQLDEHTEWSRRQLLPVLREIPGYLSHVSAVDRSTGRGVTMSTYANGSDADVAYAATAPLRTMARDRGISIGRRLQYEVAIVGIRTPVTTTLPSQRVIVLPTTTHA